MTDSEQWGEQFAPAATTEMEFSYDWYEEFLLEVAAQGYEYGQYGDPITPGTAVLRHDVDLSPRRALRMAQLEADIGVHSTYFFMVASPMYNVFNGDTRELLTAIEDLGHDVGLHFTTHQYWNPDEIPDDETVADRVLEDREVLASVADPIETVSFHIPPEPVLRHEFPGFPSTYEPQFFSEIGYSADSNQRWRTDPPRIDDFDEKMQLLVHPGLWGDSDDEFEDRVRQGVDEMEERTTTYARERYVTQKFG